MSNPARASILRSDVSPSMLSSAARMGRLFSGSAVRIANEVGREAFEAEIRARGFQLVEDGDQFIVIAHPNALRQSY